MRTTVRREHNQKSRKGEIMILRELSGMFAACLVAATVFILPTARAESDATASWNGNACVSFEYQGHKGILVKPEHATEGKPWLWSAAALEPNSMTRTLLDKGLHLAWIDLDSLYGNTDALAIADAFHAWVSGEQGLAEKPALLGNEAGALLMFNWAANNPSRAACIFSMEPWLLPPSGEEIESTALQNVYAAHGLEGKADPATFPAAPLNQAGRLGGAEIPVMLVCAGSGTVAANRSATDQFHKEYRLAGKGFFERIELPAETVAPEEGITLHALYFILENVGHLQATPTGQALPDMPEWTVADFAGSTDVHVLDKALIIECGNEMTGVRWSGQAPEGDYEITLEAMRLSGNDFFCGLTAPWRDTAFSLVVGGWGGTCIGISSLDWADAYNNETAKFRGLLSHRWYPIKLRVTGGRIQAWVDNEQLVDVDVSNREVDIRWEMAPTKPLGIATWRTTGAIRNFKIIPLAGE